MSGYAAGANGLYMSNNSVNYYHGHLHPPQGAAGATYVNDGGSLGTDTSYGTWSTNGNRPYEQSGQAAGIYQHPHHPAQLAARQQQQPPPQALATSHDASYQQQHDASLPYNQQVQQQQQQQLYHQQIQQAQQSPKQPQPQAVQSQYQLQQQQQQYPQLQQSYPQPQPYQQPQPQPQPQPLYQTPQQPPAYQQQQQLPYQQPPYQQQPPHAYQQQQQQQQVVYQQQQQQQAAYHQLQPQQHQQTPSSYQQQQQQISSQRYNNSDRMNSQSAHQRALASAPTAAATPPPPVPVHLMGSQQSVQALPLYSNSPQRASSEKLKPLPLPPRQQQATPPIRPLPTPGRQIPIPPRLLATPPRQHTTSSPRSQPSNQTFQPALNRGSAAAPYRPPSAGVSFRPPPFLTGSNAVAIGGGPGLVVAAATAAATGRLENGFGSSREGIMNDFNCTNKRKRDAVSPPLEGMMNANPKVLLIDSPVFKGCTQQSLPFILDSIGSVSNPQFRAALKIPTKDGGEAWAIGIWKTKKEAERLSALDACRQLHAAGLLTSSYGASSSGRGGADKDNSRRADLAWGENPKNILVNTPVFRPICGKGNAGSLPLRTFGRGPDHNKVFVCELSVPLGNGEVFLARGTAKTKADAERLSCTIACHKLHERGLLQKPAKGGEGGESLIKAAIVQQQNEIPPILRLGEHECSLMEIALGQWHAEGQAASADLVNGYGAPITNGAFDSKGRGYEDGCGNGLADGFEKIKMNTWDREKIATQNEILSNEAEKRIKDPALAAQRNARASLPAFKERQKIVDVVQRNRVVVLTGETGCGKTTQVPQFILEDAELHGNGAETNIVVTQPRRIAAISVAERVAWERGEQVGNSVGFAIRLDAVNPRPRGHIVFCTTGILLRRLQRSDGLEGVSHVIVDEVHERDMDTDFLLIVIREILRVNRNLKLIVMSATLDATSFQRYFGSCPLVTIPGFTFPVQVRYLEELPSLMGSACPPTVLRAVAAGQNRMGPREDEDDVDSDLVAATVMWVSTRFADGDGAVLCFLPGWDVISTVKEKLLVMPGSSKLQILLLHSQIPVGDQRAVFAKAQPGMRKVILATNIAETSVTIDDIVYVVDCGKVKENQFDPSRNMTAFRVVWTSKSSARQRQGRAGRVQAGHCFRLYSKAVHDDMAENQVPEMQRMPLEELCLQIKALSTPLNSGNASDSPLYNIGSIGSFISKALQPPASSAVVLAIKVLQQIGAIDERESLTVLGRTLARLAVHPRIGKMLVYGSLLGCLDPLLTIASAACFRDPFLSPVGKRAEVDRIRERFAVGSCTRSDHLVLVKAFDAWETAAALDGGRGFMFCDANFLSANTMRLIAGMRKQFDRTLRESGLTESWVRIPNKEEAALVSRSVITAGLYPNVAKSEMYREAKGGKTATKSYRYRLGFRAEGSRVFAHPTSVIVEKKLNTDSPHFLVFQEKLMTTQLFARLCTLVPPLSLVFFGGLVRLQSGVGVTGLPVGVPWEILDVDGFLRFAVDKRIAGLVLQLRRALDVVLARWVGGGHRTDGERAVVECVVELLKRSSGILFVS